MRQMKPVTKKQLYSLIKKNKDIKEDIENLIATYNSDIFLDEYSDIRTIITELNNKLEMNFDVEICGDNEQYMIAYTYQYVTLNIEKSVIWDWDVSFDLESIETFFDDIEKISTNIYNTFKR